MKTNRLRKTVLIAEDDRPLRATLSEVLTDIGYRVYTAEDGRQAVDIARCEIIEFSLMDVHMPVLGGFDAYREIARSTGRRIPTLFMTAHRDIDLKWRALSIGAFDLIRKPLELRALVNTFNRMTRRMLTA